jgi:hypothetical protein
VVSFSERRAGDGLICVAEDRITMIQGFASPGGAIDMLIKFREPCFQSSLVKIGIFLIPFEIKHFEVCGNVKLM